MALWFETAVCYDKMQENGTIKKTTERFLVDALSFAETPIMDVYPAKLS